MNTKTKANDLLHTITAAIQELAAATDQARMSQILQDYLVTCARFHHYSLNNQWLICLARPEATQVAGFRKWKELGRFVRQGEKGIPILAPILIKKDDDSEQRDLVGFKVVYVFDLSQTEGDPLPEPPDWKSPEKHQELLERLFGYCETKGIEIIVRTLPGDVQGVSRGGKIEISPDAGTKTLIHEIAHELMHRGEERHSIDPAIRELEAECVAYVVARHFGMTDLNSPNYNALWGGDAETILGHLARIRGTAVEIIEGVC